jgi:nitrogen fixation protein NifQ
MDIQSHAVADTYTLSDTGQANRAYFAAILSSQRLGEGCLPVELGLNSTQYQQLLANYFNQVNPWLQPSEEAKSKGDIRQQLLELRRTEWQELVQLLADYRAGQHPSELWLAYIIAAACMGSSHLWRDLGLMDRESLKQLMQLNFPILAIKNNSDMRWKKFFYRQLCEQQGHYLCRSPSCDICPTYQDCFGEEI